MTCTFITDIVSFADLLVWPTTCDYYFWLKVFLALTFIVAWGNYKVEEKRKGEGDFFSSLTISSVAFAVVGVFGSLVKNSSDIPMIQTDVLLILFALALPLLLIWIFKSK